MLNILVLFYVFVLACGREYAGIYTFMADRVECDGQCTYCRHAHHQFRWSDIRTKITRYVNRPTPDEIGRLERSNVYVQQVWLADRSDVQQFIDWSWQEGARFECIIGVINLRMLSYGYSDPFQFNDGHDFSCLEWLDVFNSHTGALDLLTSSWSAVLAGGWPVFRSFLHISRKLKDRLTDENNKYWRLTERNNECDVLDSKEDVEYRDLVKKTLRAGGQPLLAGMHIVEIARGIACPIGKAVALLSLALDMVRGRGMYQGSLKDPHNYVYIFISTAQDAVTAWAKSKTNWSPYFDLLTTQWPIWQLLDELACVDSMEPCSTRSELQCFDLVQRVEVPCPHKLPIIQRNFVGCGEHDICTMPDEIDPRGWCIPFDQRPAYPRVPFLLNMGHDDEERICSQCGQDGVLRSLFRMVGFRDAAGPIEAGGKSPFFVEFGARKPGMLNSAVIREYCLWDGILIDGQPGETPHGGCRDCPGVADIVRKEFITAENVVELFLKHSVPHDFDLLTIDTDYNDYWIWHALLTNGTFRPRIVAVDFNPDHPMNAAKVVKYEAFAEWDGSVYTVASLLAYALLARAHGYSFAYALEMGSHAFFVRNDLLAEADRTLPLRSVKKDSHMTDAKRRPFVDVLYDFPPREPSAAPPRPSGVGGEAAELARTARELSIEAAALRQMVMDAKGNAAPHANQLPPLPPRPTGSDSGAARFYDEVLERAQVR